MTKQTEWTESEVGFEIDGKEYQFNIVHNLPQIFGASIEDALHNWLARTDTYTSEDFIKYVMSKDPNFIAMTKEDYNKALKQIEDEKSKNEEE